MASEQFSLCWDNFHKNMSSGMHSLLESEDLVDVTLAVEGKYLKAHKMVLSVCSPYFRELFQVNPCKHPIVFMKDVSYVALSDLLTFMYQGEVQVNQENLATFIKTAEALQIKGLTGDGNTNDDVPDLAGADSPVKEVPKPKVIRHDDPPPRPKKTIQQTSPAPSPIAKRPKVERPILKPDVISVSSNSNNQQPHEIVQFKTEKFEFVEGGDQSNIIETVDDVPGDNTFEENMDDTQTEETEDYSIIEGDDEPQAGTSTDGLGDGQGMSLFFWWRNWPNNLYGF